MNTPDQQLVPDEPLTDNPTASEIADMVLSGEIDMSTWRYVNDSRLADAFLDVIGIIASHKHEKCLTHAENRLELLALIENSINETIKFWAEREVEGKEAGLRTLL